MHANVKPLSKQTCRSCLRENLLLMLLMIGIFIGTVVGFIVRSNIPRENVELDGRILVYIKFPGEMLMRMLKMLILPLIISTMISGIASLDFRSVGKIGVRALTYYTTTTFSAVVLGIVLVLTIRPGEGESFDILANKARHQQASSVTDTILDLLRNMVPDNLVQACLQTIQTTTTDSQIDCKLVPNITNYSNTTDLSTINVTYNRVCKTKYSVDVSYKPSSSTNFVGLVVFSLFFGAVMGGMRERAKVAIEFFDVVGEVSMRMIRILIWYSPIGVIFLVAFEIVKMDDMTTLLRRLGLYMATVLGGLMIHGLIVLPTIMFVCTRKNPYKFMYGLLQVLLTAFGTSSSSATLPLTYQCMEQKMKIDKRVTRFMLPVGATLNMDGTALYEAVAPIFIAQSENIPLSFGQVVAVSITATLAAVGAAGIPQAGIVTMLMVLTAVGLPAEGVAKILAVDWFLDRFRTMTNVLGDCIGTALVEHLSHDELERMGPLPNMDDEEEMNAATVDNRVMPRRGNNDGDGDMAGSEDGPLNFNLHEKQTRM